MRDVHQVIVDYVREVIGGEAIRLDEDLIIEDVVVEDDSSMDHVSPLA
jgi:hypothetical protein